MTQYTASAAVNAACGTVYVGAIRCSMSQSAEYQHVNKIILILTFSKSSPKLYYCLTLIKMQDLDDHIFIAVILHDTFCWCR